MVSIPKEDQEELDWLDLKVPFEQMAFQVPARIEGIQVANEEMMYRVKLTYWVKSEPALGEGEGSEEMISNDISEEGNDENANDTAKNGAGRAAMEKMNPFVADNDTFASTTMICNRVSPVKIDLSDTLKKEEEEEEANIPPLQPMKTFTEDVDGDDEEEDMEDDDERDNESENLVTLTNCYNNDNVVKVEPRWGVEFSL